MEEVNAGKAYVLDVRRDDEWAEGHAKPAIHLPVEQIQTGALPNIPKDAKIYTHCRAGGRAATAAGILKKAGYKDVTSIGGLADWQQAGGEVVK